MSSLINVIPAPVHVATGSGQFSLRPGTRVEYMDPAMTPLVERFCDDVLYRTGTRLVPVRIERNAAFSDEGTIRVELAHDSLLDAMPRPKGICPAGDASSDERYSLTVGEARIVLRAAVVIGAARGLTTLVQLVATARTDPEGVVTIHTVRILDAPRFAWRSLSLDLARTFFTTAEIRRVIDLLALYKFNALQLHLTGDQGWRLAAGRPPGRAIPDGTFYTNEELRELVRYAADRFITLIPEVDSPSHASALVQLHPELLTGRNQLEVPMSLGTMRSTWLDPELPGTYQLIEGVLAEIADIFPGPYLNIGGDEPYGMPETLFAAYVQHMRDFVHRLGKRTMGWQESIRAGVDREHVIQYWIGRTTPGAARLPPDLQRAVEDNVVRSQHDLELALSGEVPILVSPIGNTYFDVPYAEPSADPAQERLRHRIGVPYYRPKTVAESFDWEPSEVLGPAASRAQLAGVGSAIWAETIRSFDELTFMLLPRIAGVADKAWSRPSGGWADHRDRLAVHDRLWMQDHLQYFHSSAIEWA